MEFGEFFRFTKSKIVLAFILFIPSVIFFLFLFIFVAMWIDGYLGTNIPEPIGWLMYFLCLVIIYLFCYLISCVFAWVFGKFRKRDSA